MSRENEIFHFEKDRWEKRISRNSFKAKSDLRSYLAGKVLGRNFGEGMDDYLKRTNSTKSWNYLKELTK